MFEKIQKRPKSYSAGQEARHARRLKRREVQKSRREARASKIVGFIPEEAVA